MNTTRKPLSVSYQFMMTCIFIPMILLVVIVSGVTSFSIAKNEQESIISDNTQQVLELASNYVSTRFEDVISIGMQIYNSTALNAVLKDIAQTRTISSNNYIELENYLHTIFARNYSYIESIAVTFDSVPPTAFAKSFYSIQETVVQWDDDTKFSSLGKYMVEWRELGTQSSIKTSKGPTNTAGCYLYAISEQGIKFAILIELKESFIRQFLSNLAVHSTEAVTLIEQDSTYYLYEPNTIEPSLGKAISQVKKEEAKSGTLKTGSYLVIYNTININRWRIAICFNQDTIFGSLNALRRLNYLSTVIIGGLSAIFAFLFAGIIARPLKRFATQVLSIDMDDLGKTNFKGIESISSEITILAESLDNLMNRIQILIKDVEHRQNEQLKMQNRLLLAQINPHFLYNTLYAIAQECSMGNTEEACDMLYELSAFFRLGLSSGKEMVSLQDEILHITNYLQLVSRSFPYGLSFSTSIEKDLETAEIPKMTLQPIVENCFKHGLKQRRGDGSIRIMARYLNVETMEITVCDDGVGMDHTALTSVNTTINDEQMKSKGFGMFNVNQRIKYYFGTQYGLVVSSVQSKGTTVRITLPIKRIGKEQQNE